MSLTCQSAVENRVEGWLHEHVQVKNVERIELGRYEMETWYFSPLPPQFKECKVGTRAANCDATMHGRRNLASIIAY